MVIKLKCYNLFFVYILGEAAVVTPFLGRKLDEELQAKVDRCLIPKERLSLGKQLGKGNFGLVYKGQLTTPAGNLRTVAVKSIKGLLITSPKGLINIIHYPNSNR